MPRKETKLLVSNTSELLSSHFLIRIIFLRALAFIYGVAFSIAFRQNKGLIGDRGITPAREILDKAEKRGQVKSNTRRKRTRADQTNDGTMETKVSIIEWLRERLWDRSDQLDRPLLTLLWFARDRKRLNPWLDAVAGSGLALSLFMFVKGAANVPLLFALWVCQRSLMAVGGPWYGYGWEIQLAELGFHAMFLVPFLSLNKFQSKMPQVGVWAMRWFLFRIMLGAGLIKFRSRDEKWRNLTTMYYFYETQPVPNLFSRYFHWMPKWWHKGEVLVNHFVEVIAPFLLVVPFSRSSLRIGAFIQVIFQSVIIASGNLSFLNWLTMIPAIFCFDDAAIQQYFRPSIVSAAVAASSDCKVSLTRMAVNLLFGSLIGFLSIPVVRNLLSSKQQMNASFDPLRLVNTYGAFGSVSEERIEFIIESTVDPLEGPWKAYEFKVKPSNVMRSPKWISPYHYRLDWQIWLAATTKRLQPWMYTFLVKLLEQEADVLDLLESDPWMEDGIKPKYIRVEAYEYSYHRPTKGETKKPYWDRRRIRRLHPRQGLASIESITDLIARDDHLFGYPL